MKTKLILGLTVIVTVTCMFISCEEVYNVYVPEPVKDSIFTKAIETGPTPDCPYGSYLFEQYTNGIISLQVSFCKDSAKYFIVPGDTVFLPGDTVTRVRVDTVINIVRDSIPVPFPVYIYDTIQGDTVTIIKETIITKTDTLVKFIHIHHKSQFEDFNTGSSPDYWDKGWSDKNASESDYTNRYFFEYGDTAITGLPAFWKPCTIDFIKFLYGSELPYKVEVILEDNSGLWHIIERIDYPGKEGFDKYNHKDYESILIKPEKCGYMVNRIFIRVIKIPEVCYPEYVDNISGNNRQFNIDDLCWGWSWSEN